MREIIHLENFVTNPDALFEILLNKISWDERMSARKTASFGKAYNYSQMAYPYQEMLPELDAINGLLQPAINFLPNNCLVNYYPDGASKMGYHSDQTDILMAGTGIAIISLGASRTLQFRKIEDRAEQMSYQLHSGSMIYMSQQIQHEWQHAIPAADTNDGRISLTFRALV